MTNIFKKVFDTLSPLGYEVAEKGTYQAGDTLPDTLVTYQVLEADDVRHYDNQPVGIQYAVQIDLYARDPAITQTADTVFRAVMQPAGFRRAGGRSLPLDPATGHYGWTNDYNFESEV